MLTKTLIIAAIFGTGIYFMLESLGRLGGAW